MAGHKANAFGGMYILLRFDLSGNAEELIKVDHQERSWFVHDVIGPWVYIEGFDNTSRSASKRAADVNDPLAVRKAIQSGQQFEVLTTRYNFLMGEYVEYPDGLRLLVTPIQTDLWDSSKVDRRLWCGTKRGRCAQAATRPSSPPRSP